MTRVSAKVIVAAVATLLMAASSPSVSFPIDNNDSTISSFSSQNIEQNELERKEEECCEQCNGEDLVDRDYGLNLELMTPIHVTNSDNNLRHIRILTWAESKPELQAYADNYRSIHPEAPTIQILSVPSIKELEYEVTSELRLGSTIFDSFVVPPLLLGDMLRPRGGQAIAIWTDEETTTSAQLPQKEPKSFLDNLLPYYRYTVATYGGKLRGLPIISGSQALIIFRKDYLDTLNLPTPKTWEDWTRIATEFASKRDSSLRFGQGFDGNVYGACLGLLNEAGCRRRNSLGGRLCKSQTMTYFGMIMATFTQYAGNSTGYMMGMNEFSPNGLDPLFETSLQRILEWMEKQIENSTPDSLTEDYFDSMKNFRDGRCAWTISVDHDINILKDENIGFVPLPGSSQVLDRRPSAESALKTNTSAVDQDNMKTCAEKCGLECQQTGSKAPCPYGKDFASWGRVNQVPFGAMNTPVGTVSALVSYDRQIEAKEFLKFVLDTNLHRNDTLAAEGLYGRIQQPLTYTELKKFDVPNYEETLKSLTSNANAAIPFRIPNAFDLLSDLDDKIYNYLVDGEYSRDKRDELTRKAEKSWQAMISMYDSRVPHNKQPTSTFYELSLGAKMTSSLDLYIGWAARGVMWTLAGLSCLVSVCFALWVWTYERERVIRASQPVFLYLICFGTFVMASSVFTLGIEDDIASNELTSATCMASYWLYSLGFTAVISVLFSKIWMLSKVFQKPRNEQRIQITKQDILFPFFFIFGLDCVVLTVWTILDRQQWVRMPVQNNDPNSLFIADESTVGWCVSEHSSWYIGLLLVFNIIILILSLVQSYECRRITTEYAESVWVTIAIATTAQAWFISLPLVVLLDDNPTWWFILRSSTVLCTTFAILLLIFAPKMKYLYEALKDKKARLNYEQAKEMLFDDNGDLSGAITMSGSLSTSFRESSPQNANQRRKDPKGTIGIRIVQFTFLDSDEVDELEDAVDKAEHRNKVLKDTKDRLKGYLEEHQFVRNHLFSNNGNPSRSKPNKNQRIIGTADFGSIIEAKPENLRHNRISRRSTFHT